MDSVPHWLATAVSVAMVVWPAAFYVGRKLEGLDRLERENLPKRVFRLEILQGIHPHTESNDASD